MTLNVATLERSLSLYFIAVFILLLSSSCTSNNSKTESPDEAASSALSASENVDKGLNPNFKRYGLDEWEDPKPISKLEAYDIAFDITTDISRQRINANGDTLDCSVQIFFEEDSRITIVSEDSPYNAWLSSNEEFVLSGRVLAWNGKKWDVLIFRDSLTIHNGQAGGVSSQLFFLESSNRPFILMSQDYRTYNDEDGTISYELTKKWLNLDDLIQFYSTDELGKVTSTYSDDYGRSENFIPAKRDSIRSTYDYYSIKDKGPTSIAQFVEKGWIPNDEDILSMYQLKFKYNSKNKVVALRLVWSVPESNESDVALEGGIYHDEANRKWYRHGDWINKIHDQHYKFDMERIVIDYNHVNNGYAQTYLDAINNSNYYASAKKCRRCNLGYYSRNFCSTCGSADPDYVRSSQPSNSSSDILNCRIKSGHVNIVAPYSCPYCSYRGR